MAKNNGNGKSGNPDVLGKSVTQGDYAKTPYDGPGGINYLMVPGLIGSIGDLPGYWSPYRDQVLRLTITKEAMWASAVHIAVTKVATSDWRISGRRIRRWQELLLAADKNQSFVSYQEKQAKDFLLTDNGCFTEIIRATRGSGSRIIGLAHLDSLRCIRTGDADIPIIYQSRDGKWHEMRDYQVMMMSDEPDTGYFYFNVGFCSASRAYPAIMKMHALETYIHEKISGKRPLAIYLINANIKEKQLQNAVDVQKQKNLEQGYVQYMGVVMIPNLDPNSSPAAVKIDVAGLPDGFMAQEERTEGKLTYCAAIGLDPNDLDPQLTNRKNSLGTGSQAQILDDKQSGKGIASFPKKQQYLLNEYVFPDRVVYSMYSPDLVDRSRRAEISEKYARSARDLVGNGQAPPIITPEQAKNWLVDIGEIPSEFMVEDLTGDEALSDMDKPSLELESEHIEPRDAKLMQTEQKKLPAPAAPKQIPAKTGTSKETLRALVIAEKSYEQLLNRAEDWAFVNVENADELEDDELIDTYVQFVTAKKEKGDVTT